MKTKHILLIVITLLLTGCNKKEFIFETYSTEKSKQVTTLEQQAWDKDTVMITVDGDDLYIFNDDNQVIYEIELYDQYKKIPINKWWVFITWLLSIVGVWLLIDKIVGD
jgi:hypothetical protein